MKESAVLLALLVLSSYCLNPLYHTSDQIIERLDYLSESCSYLKPSKIKLNEGEIPFYELTDSSVKIKSNALLLFGEHARELISSELALFFVETVCQVNEYAPAEKVKNLLSQSRFVVVPVSNRNGRVAVENGDYCKRTNENNVDINRNWPFKWKRDFTNKRENPGEKPFSEWETRAIDKLYSLYSFNVFISIHSGMLGMGVPFAYRDNFLKDNQTLAKQEEILSELSKAHCDCTNGPMKETTKYSSAGNCLDYAYSVKKIKNSFAFEIFDSGFVSQKYQKALDNPNLTVSSVLPKEESKAQFLTGEPSEKDCFSTFNPTTELHYTNTLKIWTNVLFELSDKLSK